ncbi:ParB N-terminal domain-containing protein (plasmid) [Paraclostridium ghonii]|uniref:ParB N-terminal domain-containing protein n=1 Tax=Paraclostridium ghonii TaxID=29358 RepID=UPI00202D0C10|nr:ParB N-terminal domain-containing protein [Paeniclostridium ghonii]MCM0167622.1 ParB N-terminal domain-containing protein [Paeniclostridium ghonii]
MDIKTLKVEQLIPYKNNPRNNINAVDKVALSIKEFGFKVPIVIDRNNIVITGHTRLLASKKLGLEEVPVIVADDLTEAQIKAFRIADNKVSEYSTWDKELLKVELEQLEGLDFNLDLVSIDFYDFNMDIDLDDIDLPDELELERTERGNVILKNLKFGSYNITLSDEEFKMLTVLVEKYIEKTGVLQGFVQDLVGGMF